MRDICLFLFVLNKLQASFVFFSVCLMRKFVNVFCFGASSMILKAKITFLDQMSMQTVARIPVVAPMPAKESKL